MPREIDRRTALRAGGGLLAGAFVAGLVGCSSSSNNANNAAPSGTSTPPAGPATSPSASSPPSSGKRGGTLRFGTASGISGESPDPAVAIYTLQLAIAANCYDTLTFADQNYNLKPYLATEWSSNTAGTEWTFKLRDGVTFHDGSPLTSKDVAYTFKRILDPKTTASALSNFAPILKPRGIQTPDAKTVKFVLEKPNAFFPVLLSQVPTAIVKDGTTDFSKGNGTGAFSIAAFDSITKLNLVRYDHYWQNGLPYLDGVNYSVLPEDATRLQALTSGSQDVADNITGASTLLLKGNVKPYMIKTGGWVALTMFGNQAPYNDPDVIRAMQFAADRQKIMSVVAPGIDILSPDVPLPMTDPFYPAGLKPRPYDPDQAKSLLRKAGMSNLKIPVWAYEGDKLDTVTAYKSTAAAAGINVQIQNVPHDTFFSDDYLKKPAIGISSARQHISQLLPQIYGTGSSSNMTHFSNAHVDQLVALGTATTNTAKQKQHFADALTIINDSAANVIPGWEGQVYGLASNVTGMLATNGGQVYQTATAFA